MKRSIKIAVAAAVALSATSAFATNGDNLIGVGAKSRGMGGIGIGMSHGAESALANPAMISTVKGTEISFGGTVFMPDVQVNNGSAGFKESAADLSVIPEVAVAQKVSDNFTWGIGMFGTAGMGVDYRDNAISAQTMQMVTNLQLMQFAVPLAYSTNGFTIAIAPVMQYGSLDMNYDTNGTDKSPTQGVAQDFGFGYNLGASYTMGAITVGAVYKSAIDMEYKGQLAKATQHFKDKGMLTTALSDHLEQPAEVGVGASYKVGEHTFAVDYKQIKWSDAKGYKDFGWDDQNVYALGYEFNAGSWAARLGYNHANNPIDNRGNQTYNMLNLLGFPGIVEDHYTLGGSIGLSKQASLDLAYVYVPEEKQTLTGPYGAIEVKHSQQAISAQVNFNF